MNILYLVPIIVLLLVSVFLLFLFSKKSYAFNLEEKKANRLENDNLDLQRKLENSQKSQEELKLDLAVLKTKSQSEQKANQKIQENNRLQFEQLANKIFEEKSQKFANQNQENINNLLKPLSVKINEFQKQVHEVYDKEAKERFSLGKEIKNLIDLNQTITEETRNLTGALKGDSKVQGDWGEMILERILERSGLRKNSEYFLQQEIKDSAGKQVIGEDNKKMRPDVIIHYPENRCLIIDSKVSLTAYSQYFSTQDEQEKKQAIDKHIKSIRRHIDELSQKSYDDAGEKTLDFVMMFIPNETAYLLALQAKESLWEYAYKKRVVLISPTNLIAALKLISNLWAREHQNNNALEIADRGAKLYDKFVGFVENFEKVGHQIDKAKESYDQSLKQLSTGKDNLVRQSEKLQELGVKTKKQLKITSKNKDI